MYLEDSMAGLCSVMYAVSSEKTVRECGHLVMAACTYNVEQECGDGVKRQQIKLYLNEIKEMTININRSTSHCQTNYKIHQNEHCLRT